MHCTIALYSSESELDDVDWDSFFANLFQSAGLNWFEVDGDGSESDELMDAKRFTGGAVTFLSSGGRMLMVAICWATGSGLAWLSLGAIGIDWIVGSETGISFSVTDGLWIVGAGVSWLFGATGTMLTGATGNCWGMATFDQIVDETNKLLPQKAVLNA